MRRFFVVLVAAGLLLGVPACSARIERVLELAWDDVTASARDYRRNEVIRVGPIQ
jgi:hypothetical protein